MHQASSNRVRHCARVALARILPILLLSMVILNQSSWSLLRPQISQAAATPWVSAYYLGYFWDWIPDPVAAVNAVDMSTMTHLLFARYAPGAGSLGGAAGQVLPGAGTGHTAVEDPLITKAHANNVKALLMMGGAGDGPGFDASTANLAVRTTFITNILNQAVAKNYDGVDINWEENLDTVNPTN